MIIDNPTISGSALLSGSLTITGPLNVSGSISGLASNAVSASYALIATTASYALNATTSSYALIATSASYALASTSASYSNNATSASYSNDATSASYALASTSASYSNNSTSASYAFNATTSSYAVNATSASYALIATTASYADTFTVAGTLTAQKLVVQTITSSVVYSSGSNIFGNSVSNTQSMTGSVGISGSLSVNGISTLAGVLSGTSATFSSTITTANNGGTSVNITTNGNSGTSASPLQTNVNFYGYNANLNGQIRVDDIAGTAQIGTMKFYTYNSSQVLALTLAHTGAATFSSTVNASSFQGTSAGQSSPASYGATNGDNASAILTAGTTAGYVASVQVTGNYNGSSATGGDVIIKTASTERMRITSGGNVGIGTSSPEALLHLNQASSGGEGAFIFVDNSAGSTLGNRAGIRFATNSGATFSGYGSFIEAVNVNASDGAESLTFGTWNGVSRGERMRITSGGNVGIGTSSPATRLEVKNPTLATDTVNTLLTQRWSRDQTGAVKWGNSMDLLLGSYESGTINSRSRVDFRLANGATDTPDTTVMTLQANGNVGIGTTAPTVKLEVGGASNIDCQARFFKTSEGTLLLGGNRSTSNCPFIGSENNYDFAFITNNTERMRITSDAYVRLASGTGGIQFNGDTAAANALDDYEEGSWTPALQNATVSYSERSGSYVKIGNYVFVRWGLRISSISGKSGTVTIAGLPFTAVSFGSYQEPNISVSTGGLSTADYAQRARIFVNGGASTLVGRIANNSDTSWDTSELQNGTWIIGEIFYNV